MGQPPPTPAGSIHFRWTGRPLSGIGRAFAHSWRSLPSLPFGMFECVAFHWLTMSSTESLCSLGSSPISTASAGFVRLVHTVFHGGWPSWHGCACQLLERFALSFAVHQRIHRTRTWTLFLGFVSVSCTHTTPSVGCFERHRLSLSVHSICGVRWVENRRQGISCHGIYWAAAVYIDGCPSKWLLFMGCSWGLVCWLFPISSMSSLISFKNVLLLSFFQFFLLSSNAVIHFHYWLYHKVSIKEIINLKCQTNING